jgi:hypothetical protein
MTQPITYHLATTPDMVLQHIAAGTTTFRSSAYLVPETNHKTAFWSKIDGHRFWLYQKPSARGYANSYAPWLYGILAPTNDGCSLQISFHLDPVVQRIELITHLSLYFFSAVMALVVVHALDSGNFNRTILAGMGIIGMLWLGRMLTVKWGTRFGQHDQRVLIQFLESRLAPFHPTYVSSQNCVTVQGCLTGSVC